MILKHSFTPAHTQRLSHLCGPMDGHLRHMEMSLRVKISHRHEHFRIDGHKAQAERALEVLQALYERAARPIPPEQVQLMLAGDASMSEDEEGAMVLHTRRSDLRARTPNQSVYLEHIANHDITFGIGPAGTGKTYLAVACAVDALERSAVQRIVLTRPAVEAGEKLGFAQADVIIEAATEQEGLKRSILKSIDAMAKPQAILASNTSSISITALAASSTRPERFVGMHFFNPVPLMQLVEVISGLATSASVADSIVATAAAWGKLPVRATSTPGFIVNRIARPFYLESLRCLQQGLADCVTLDRLLQYSGGFRMGPFALMDLIGLDVNLAVHRAIWQAMQPSERKSEESSRQLRRSLELPQLACQP